MAQARLSARKLKELARRLRYEAGRSYSEIAAAAGGGALDGASGAGAPEGVTRRLWITGFGRGVQ